MKFDILNRFTGKVQFTADIDCKEDEEKPVKIGMAVKWAIHHNIDLCYTDLRGADLRNSNLRNVNLCHINFRDVNFYGADLRNANLYNSDLRNANLCADLHYANLHYTDLRGADLRGAELDFSVLPLWCGSFDIKADMRLAAQLAYHFCKIDFGKDETTKEARNAQKMLKGLANKYHRVKKCGEIE
jgi:hypothetical protein